MTDVGQAPPPPELADGVLVVGAGLIGTSIGLALSRAGVPVHVVDTDPAQESLAAGLGAGAAGWPEREPALVVVAVPVPHTKLVVESISRRYLNASITDVGSVKSYVQVDVESLGPVSARFVGGHPMAGRERSGAAMADPDLFEGRPWVLTPTDAADGLARSRADALVRACGADLVRSDPRRHDEGVALVSHAPQVVASLMAARLADADGDLVGLAGPGVRDVTRVAGSDPELWTGILAANAGTVLPVLDAVAEDLDRMRAALRSLSDLSGSPQTDKSTNRRAQDEVTQLLANGVRGRERLPGKHGGRATSYAVVPVVVSDQPGQLARLFTAADEAGVNIEDVSIEHAAGHPVGVVELMVAPDTAGELALALRERGWSVHG